ncbi:hypothetical protein HYV70_02685 [Candidatus Uhrbacteria bacterium]|nr:hypothetical protein [Candidatus Uhrbacteria bacterium]
MKTIPVEELHRFLLIEACAHTSTWLYALRWSPARSALSKLLKQARIMVPRIGTNTDVAREARKLAYTIEMDGVGVGGFTKLPSTLWPKEFSQNPWDYADKYPHMKRERIQFLWERWNLRRDSFHRLTERIKQILRAIEFFDNPRDCGEPPYQGNVAKGYHARYCLTQQIAMPDLHGLENQINMRIVRPTTGVEWLHVENNEQAEFDDEALMHIREKAWQQGIRGIFFVQHIPNSKREVILRKPASDIRLRHWLPYDQWRPEYYSVSL